MIPSSVLLAIPLMIGLTVIQTAVLPHFPILGIVPSFPFLVALSWGLLRGVDEGVIWAFIGGFFMDLFTAAPAGGLALSYMIATFAAVQISELLPANRIILPALLTALATGIQLLSYALFLTVFGYGALDLLVGTFLPTVLLQAFLILPIYWLLHLLQQTIWPKPVEV